MRLWDCITKENQERIARRYKERFGMKFILPEKDKAIQCESQREPQLEDLSEMVQIMEESPNYAIDKQGREK